MYGGVLLSLGEKNLTIPKISSIIYIKGMTMKKIIGYYLILFFLLINASCEQKTAEKQPENTVTNFTVTPNSSNMYGNIPIKITSNSFPLNGDKVVVYIGNSKMYNLSYAKGVITGYIEGSPISGKMAITVYVDDRKFVLKDAFEYKVLKYPLFKNMFAVGASYTQGFVSMGLNWRTQLHSPFAQLAKQVGAYFPQPLIKEGILQEATLNDAKKSCNASTFLGSDLTKTLGTLRKIKYDEDEDVLSLASYRLDPDLQPHNLGIGGSTIQDTIEGAEHGRLPALTLSEQLVYNPYVNITEAYVDPPAGSQFDYVMSQKPTVLFSTDLFADDILVFALGNGEPVTDEITKVSVVREELIKMFDKLKENNVTAYIANMPDITVMTIFNYFYGYLRNKGYN